MSPYGYYGGRMDTTTRRDQVPSQASDALDLLEQDAVDLCGDSLAEEAVHCRAAEVRAALLTPVEAAGLVAGINAFSEGPIVTVVWSHDLLAKLRRIAGDS